MPAALELILRDVAGFLGRKCSEIDILFDFS